MMQLTDHVKHKADEPVIPGKRDKESVDKHNVLEVIDDRFAVQKVVGHDEKVPVVNTTQTCPHQFRALLHPSFSSESVSAW
jgi:hypothetical protein